MEKLKKYSRKRQAILDLLRSTEQHPSAEWIYSYLKDQFNDLSLGTVYRNLSMFRREGTIASLGSVNGNERFDGQTYRHAHFICEKCGKISDLPAMEAIREFYSDIFAENGDSAIWYSLNIYGVCRDCGGN